MTIPTRKADSRRSGYSPGLDSFQAIFPGTVFRFARRCQKSVITRYDTAIPLYQGLARSFGYKAKTLIKIQIVSLSAFLFGGGGGNRTPVRKQLDGNFSGRSLLFTFPQPGGNKHPTGIGSFMMHGTGKAYRTHGHHYHHTRTRLVVLPGRMGGLIRLPEQRFRCQLILKVARFIVVRRHGPLFRPHCPRRNQYAPI